MNIDLQEVDNISTKLVDIYEDFIFKADLTKEENIKLVKDIDHVLNSYIEDYAFRKEVKSKLFTIRIKKTGKDILTLIVEAIIGLLHKYI